MQFLLAERCWHSNLAGNNALEIGISAPPDHSQTLNIFGRSKAKSNEELF